MRGAEQLTEERWLRILRDQCNQTSIADVARKIDYSRSAISLVLSGKYQGATDRIAAKVMAAFTDYVACPFLGEDIDRATCTDHQSRAQPCSDPQALRHWITCRTACPHSCHTIEDDKRNA